MSFDYFRRYYAMDVREGDRVEYTGGSGVRYGTVTGTRDAHLLICMDGDVRAGSYHPTWELRVLPRTTTATKGPKT